METAEATTELPSPETVKKVDDLLREIGSSRGARKAAEAELQSMGIEAALAIGSLLEPKLASRRKARRLTRKAALGLAWIFALWFVVANFWLDLYAAYWFSLLFFLGAPILYGLAVTVRSICEPSHSVHIRALAGLSDKRMIPTLLDVYGLLETGQGRIVGVLTRMLPRLTASDAPLLTKEHRKRLHGFLDHWSPSKKHYPSEFIVAILRGLEQVGDKSSVPFVARLANNYRDTPVRRAARLCLPYLEARSKRGADTLLRAASATALPGELLRAAAYTSTDAQEELLRADLGTAQDDDRQGLTT